ncbi:MAG: restriction endonuclease subunit S [Candidatus Latescibacteria bacterium]|nr:restriction endonuclease subunit S [Candidatus Latescibacterota bacterium]
MRQMIDFRDYLIEKFSDIDKALSFLEVLLEEHEKDPDGAALYYGFSAAVEAQGGVQKFALKTHSTPQAISDALLSKDEIQIAELLKKQVLTRRGKDKDIAQNRPLPKGWREVKIIDFSPLQRGFDLPAAQIKEGTYPVVYSNGIKNHHSEYKAKAPGVVTGRSGTIGEVTYVTQDYWPHNTSLWVTDFKGNHPKFVFYFLQNLRLDRFYAGSGVPTLNRNDVHKKSILIPTLPEQKAIASLLEKWDKDIEKTEALIEAKEKRFKWLMTRLIAQSCKHWNHYKASELFKNISCKGYPKEELLSVTQDRGVIPRYMLEGRVMSPTNGTDSYKLVEPGNFVISLRSFQGGLEYSKYRGIISPAYTVLLPEKKINDDFYRHFFKTYIFVEKYLALAVIGIRDGKQINLEAFKSIKLPLPSLPEQQRIAQTLNTAQQEIYLLKQLAEQYRTQKRGLMQKLLTGKWRVKPNIKARI